MLCQVMLPDSKDQPALIAKHFPLSLVTRNVRVNFLPPPRGIGARGYKVLFAAVPEAAIDKHAHLGTRKDDVG